MNSSKTKRERKGYVKQKRGQSLNPIETVKKEKWKVYKVEGH